MDHHTDKTSGDQLSDPSTAESQVEEGAEDTSLPTKKDPVYMPIEGVQLEELEMYQVDGFHPVHLGDKLYNDDYEVVAKLGDGGYGTVWLCMEGPERDGHTVWRAVKVIAACASHEENPELRIIDDLRNEGITRSQWEEAGILLPITHFTVTGPNGDHLCLVFPVMGPSLVSQMGASVDTIKDVLTQAGKSLQFLHENGVCHGDFTSDNVLLHIDDVGRISKNEMIALLEGQTHEVKMADGSEPLSPNAPRYLVQRGDITNLSPKTQTATIDFGISYQTGDPPEFVGVPAQYAAPEAFFRIGNTGPTSDVWSYICMIMEIRCRAMFYRTSKRSEYVQDLQALLGPLPDSYRLAWKAELAHEGVVDDDEDNDFVSMTEEEFKSKRQDAAKQSGYADYLQGLIGAGQEHVVYQRDADYTPSPTKVTWRVPEEEVYQLADLFQKVLKYDPDERIRIGEVLQHEWFQVGEAAEDGEKPAKASPTTATRTSLAGTKGATAVPKTEEKRVTAIKSTDPSKSPGNADKGSTVKVPESTTTNNGRTASPAKPGKDATTPKLSPKPSPEPSPSAPSKEKEETTPSSASQAAKSGKDATIPKSSTKASSKEKKETTPTPALQRKDPKPSTSPPKAAPPKAAPPKAAPPTAAPPKLEPVTERPDPNPKKPTLIPPPTVPTHHHNPSAHHPAFDTFLHLLSIFFLISTLAFIIILLLPIPILPPPPPTTTMPPTTIIRGGYPLRFPQIATIRQAWCGAGAPGCGSGINSTGAAPPIPWFRTRGVSPYSVFYEGILTVPSNDTDKSQDGEGDRQVESGTGGKKKRFEGLLVIPGI